MVINPDFIKSFPSAGTTEVPLLPYRIATILTTGKVGLATATSNLLGIFNLPLYSSITDGRMVDVHLNGIAPVEYGGTINIGDRVKSDANGRAVVAASGDSLGIALIAGVTGDIGSVLIR